MVRISTLEKRATLADCGNVCVPILAHDDFDGWRQAARRLIQAGVAPGRVGWSLPGEWAGEAVGDLFADDAPLADAPSADAPSADSGPVLASRAFLDLAQGAALHADPARFDVLYRLLWRLQSVPRLMDDRADPDVRAIDALARDVRRDIHRMRAFVRFRAVQGPDGEHHVAWFEPVHHILDVNAGFFVRRFAAMRWSILTPQGTLHWDGTALRKGPPASRADLPEGDPVDALWRKYHAAIFNPARLIVDAMAHPPEPLSGG